MLLTKASRGLRIKYKPVSLYHQSCTLSTLDGSPFPDAGAVPPYCGVGLSFPGILILLLLAS